MTTSADLLTFKKTVRVDPKYKGNFALRYPNGRVLLTLNGEFFYFATYKRALLIQKELRLRYEVETELIYGPASKKGESGTLASPPKRKPNKNKITNRSLSMVCG